MKYSITKLTSKSNATIDYLFEKYPHLLKKIKDTYFIKLIYTLLDKANVKTNYTLTTEENIYVKPKQNDFISKEIMQHIEETKYTLYTIIFDIKGIKIHVKLYTEKININKYIYFIRLILNLCANESKQTKDFYITFYLTPFEKLIPTTSIDTIHINSGYTYKNEIVIYRKEEWFKVFIHECFHLFCLDFDQVSIDFKKLFSPLFFIKSDFLFFETLVEFWARTLNISIVSYFTKKNISYEEFEFLMEVNLSIERVYAIIQMKHILNAVNTSYSQMIQTSENDYKETTNGFCYYVLTALLFSHYEQTMAWFVEHNQTLLQFQKNTKHVYMFYHYIRSIYNSPHFLKEIDKPHYDVKHVSMSAFDIQF